MTALLNEWRAVATISHNVGVIQLLFNSAGKFSLRPMLFCVSIINRKLCIVCI